MSSETTELTPQESTRRAAAIAKANKIVIRLGFRRVPARLGWWWHESLGETRAFPLTVSHSPVEDVGEVLCHIFDHGHAHGRASVQSLLRQALG